jgi:hypothetical protein
MEGGQGGLHHSIDEQADDNVGAVARTVALDVSRGPRGDALAHQVEDRRRGHHLQETDDEGGEEARPAQEGVTHRLSDEGEPLPGTARPRRVEE